ncbi:MAG: hypothetical protein JWN66_3933 [Sphingomonas bacterium]|uniref:hypothetical protein n=1 Tax=Sphingomonas bacterium TaxID=1895847 RepID=UPI002636122A|nr:hypothetical protein [Sphingomonas bacterium]MDB5706817.1 hypothetical protein [Sphingomonas bacterium]
MKALAILPMLLATAQATPPATIDGLPFAVLPKQELPARGCAAFLWTTNGTRALVAMATADPAQLRLSIGGTITDLPRDQQQGLGGFGFADTAEYKVGDVTATLDMKITARGDLKDGASVPEGTLRLDRTGQDSVVLPVVGLIGCA